MLVQYWCILCGVLLYPADINFPQEEYTEYTFETWMDPVPFLRKILEYPYGSMRYVP